MLRPSKGIALSSIMRDDGAEVLDVVVVVVEENVVELEVVVEDEEVVDIVEDEVEVVEILVVDEVDVEEEVEVVVDVLVAEIAKYPAPATITIITTTTTTTATLLSARFPFVHLDLDTIKDVKKVNFSIQASQRPLILRDYLTKRTNYRQKQ